MPDQAYLLELYAASSTSVFGEGWDSTVGDAFESRIAPDARSAWIRSREAASRAGRYLEIGPGDGALLRYFESRRWECHAVEPGAWARGSDNFVDSLDQLSGDDAFDVIVASDVLEHTADPLGTARRLSALLAPDGRIYVSFPNSSSLRARLQKERWRMVRPIGHLHYFSRESVTELLARSSLRLRHIESYDLLEPLGLQARTFLSAARARALGRAGRVAASGALSLLSDGLRRGDQWRIVASPSLEAP
jgi:SAM-dependent methyltransferase